MDHDSHLSTVSRVLVTGASGFIGRRVVEQLLASGHEVHGVRSRDGADRTADIAWHQADLLDPKAIDLLTADVQATQLLHLAWYAVPGQFWTAVENVEWIGATLHLLQSFAAAGGRRAVVTGTCAEYEWGHLVLRENSTSLAPTTLYGTCKHATHIAASALCQQIGVSLAWGRIFFLYGPHEDSRRLVSSIARGLLSGERVPASDGSQIRDFLHVDDVAGALVALLGSDVMGPVNIASGRPVAVRTIIEAIAEASGGLDCVDFGALPARQNDPERLVADVARLQDEVGFTPRIPLAQGIEDTVTWWREEIACQGEEA